MHAGLEINPEMLHTSCCRFAAGQQIFLHLWNYYAVWSCASFPHHQWIRLLAPLLHYFQQSLYWQKWNVLKYSCELLISININKLLTFSLDKLCLFQHLVDPATLQPKVCWIFFFCCPKLLQRRCKVHFWHIIMILEILESEIGCSS